MEKHCKNYGCSLKPECICKCESYKPVGTETGICSTCGVCKECGARVPEKEIVYIPYPVYQVNTYYCSNCYQFHLIGYTCFTTPYNPYVLPPIPITYTLQAGDPSPNNTYTLQAIGIESSSTYTTN